MGCKSKIDYEKFIEYCQSELQDQYSVPKLAIYLVRKHSCHRKIAQHTELPEDRENLIEKNQIERV